MWWFCLSLAANKDELLEMITHGAEHIVNSNDESVFFLFLREGEDVLMLLSLA